MKIKHTMLLPHKHKCSQCGMFEGALPKTVEEENCDHTVITCYK